MEIIPPNFVPRRGHGTKPPDTKALVRTPPSQSLYLPPLKVLEGFRRGTLPDLKRLRVFLTLTLGQSQARSADTACIEGVATWPTPRSSTTDNMQHAKKLTTDWHAIHGAATWHTKELSNGKHAVRTSHTPRIHALYRQPAKEFTSFWKAYLGGTSGGRASV